MDLLTTSTVSAFVAGATSTYVAGLALGVAPSLLGGKETRPWARQYWGEEACKRLDALDSNWRYFLFRIRLSNRNYVISQAKATGVIYISILDQSLKGVARLGDKPQSQGECEDACFGSASALADQILGLYSVFVMKMPVVTANLKVSFHSKIKQGQEFGLECFTNQTDSIKKVQVTIQFFTLDEERTPLITATGLFVNPMLPNFIKSLL